MTKPGDVGEKSGMNKLTDDDVRDIRALLAKGYKQRDIAKIYEVSQGTIGSIKAGHTWNHVQ